MPISESSLKITKEYAPLILCSAYIILSTRFPFAVDIKCKITSVSEVDWNIEPSLISFFF